VRSSTRLRFNKKAARRTAERLCGALNRHCQLPIWL